VLLAGGQAAMSRLGIATWALRAKRRFRFFVLLRVASCVRRVDLTD
jgi:hypothetical protein